MEDLEVDKFSQVLKKGGHYFGVWTKIPESLFELKKNDGKWGGVIFYCLANEPRYASMPRVDRLNWYARGGRA